MNGLLLLNLPCSLVIFVVFVMCIAKHRCCWFLVISVFHLIIVLFSFYFIGVMLRLGEFVCNEFEFEGSSEVIIVVSRRWK